MAEATTKKSTVVDEENLTPEEKIAREVARINEEMEEYTSIKLFKDGDKYKDDVVVTVNGETCVVQRGVRVQIKRKFANAIDYAEEQRAKAAEYMSAMSDKYKEEEKQFMN